MQQLLQGVKYFVQMESNLSGNSAADYETVCLAIHQMNGDILNAENSGFSYQEIKSALEPVYAIYARSPFFCRMQTWPRGYQGDFETIEYLCDAHNGSTPQTVEYYCEQAALNAHIVQQHRNKLHRQAELALGVILGERLVRQGPPRILSVACGGCRDLAPFARVLDPLHCRLVLNDMDTDALALAEMRLAGLGDSCQVVPGNILRRIRELVKYGPFDLILVGGLFDYLEDKHIAFLFKHCRESLLAPGGMLFCTNVGPDNPQKTWQRYFTNWTLIERSEGDLQRLAGESGFCRADVKITRDTTRVALLAELTRP